MPWLRNGTDFNNGFLPVRKPYSVIHRAGNIVKPIKALVETSSFPLFQQPQNIETPPEVIPPTSLYFIILSHAFFL